MVDVVRSPFEWKKPEVSERQRRRGWLIGSGREQEHIYVWFLTLLLLRTVVCQDGGTCSTVLKASSGDELASLVACQSERDGELTIAVPKVVLESGVTVSGNRAVKISSGLDDGVPELQCTKGERILEIRSGAKVTLSNLKITGCDLSDIRGAIHVERGSTLILNNIQFEGNSNGDGPGVLSIVDSEVFLEGCEFRKNEGINGGGISVRGASKLSIVGSVFYENSAKEQGGSIHATSEVDPMSVTVEDTLFQGNVASKGEGGGIYVFGDGVSLSVLDNTLFLSNVATLEGGAIFMLNASNTLVEGSSFMANTAGGGGGALYFEVGNTLEREEGKYPVNITMTGSTLIGNAYKRINKKALGGGGAVLLRGLRIAFNVTQSKFKSNKSRFDGGAIYGLRLASLSLQGVEFRDNHAGENEHKGAGGAISLLEGNRRRELKTLITDTSFIDNTSNSGRGGGGMFVGGFGSDVTLKENVKFVRNNVHHEFGGGGGIRLSDGVRLNALDGPEFIENSATCGGALMGQKDIVYKVTRGVFKKNKATQGGGVCNVGNVAVFLVESIFEENRAEEEGGAFWMLNQNSFGGQDSEAKIINGTFSRNSAGSLENGTGSGGAFFLKGVGLKEMKFHENSYRNNTASFGGAFAVHSPQQVFIYRSREFSGNEAILGGTIFAILELNLRGHQATCFIEDSLMGISNNKATFGGAIYAKSQTPTLTEMTSQPSKVPVIVVINTTMSHNEAVEGGGAVYLSGVQMYSNNTMFSRNIVSKGHPAQGSDTSGGGGILLRDGARLDGQATKIEDNEAKNGTGGGILSVDSQVQLSNVSLSRCSAAKGGGLYVKFTGKGSKTNITGEFRNNTAHFGGGIHVENKSLNRREMELLPQVFLGNSSIEGNLATFAGGGIFTDDPGAVYWTCRIVEEFEKNNDTKGGLLSMGEDCGSQLKENNKVETGATFGSGVATIPTKVSASPKKIIGHTSGNALKQMNISFLDPFRQEVKGFMITALARSSSPNITLSGQTDSVRNENITFRGLRVTGPPGTSDGRLNLTFGIAVFDETLIMLNLQIKVGLRNCTIGEILKGNECQRCPTRQYNFELMTATNCKPCPEGATCDGSTLIPDDGYWHSTSQSPQIHRCLSINGCKTNNTLQLMKKVNDEIQKKMLEPLTGELSYPQCAEGFHGVLCGACDDNYGRASGSQECEECRPRDQSTFLLSFIWLWALIILAVIVHSNTTLAAKLEFLSTLTPSRMTQIFGVSSWRVEQAPTSYIVEEVEMAVTNESREEMQNVDESRELAQIDEVVIANPATEVLKVLLNFLQITSIAFLLNVQWNATLRQLLIWQGAAVNVSMGHFSLDCVLGEGTLRKSIRRMIYLTFLPFSLGAVLWLLAGVFVVLGIKSTRWFARSVYATALSTVYVFYTYLTRTLAQTLNCVSVDDSDVIGFDEKVSTNSSTYWSEDMDVTCWEGDHLLLVSLLGIPMLLAVSVGGPVGLLIVLVRNRERLNEREFLERYGFLYKSYKEAWRYWEVVIMMRKALLAVVVVFSFELGGNLQGILAVVVLTTALSAHLIAMPYSDNLRALNALEACSLVVSSLVFVAGVIFNDPRTSDEAEIFITGFIFVIVFLLLAALLHRMYIGLHIWLKLKLVQWGMDPSERFHKNTVMAVGRFKGVATDVLIRVQRQTERLKVIVRQNTV